MLKFHGYFYAVLASPAKAAYTLLRVTLLCLSICAVPLAHAAEGNTAVTEQQIKAAMLYKFLGYVEWSEDAIPANASPFRIWVLGADDIHHELQAITTGRHINHRSIEVFTARSVRAITAPHLVFVGRDAERYLSSLRQLAQQGSFLIVTENQQGLPDDSIINLRIIDGRIGFDVSLINAHRQNLKLSARLLSVASSVEQEKQ